MTHVLRYLDITANEGSIRWWIQENGDDFDFTPQKKPKPTDALPGSPEKLRVLVERAENSCELWHELDRNTLQERIQSLTETLRGIGL